MAYSLLLSYMICILRLNNAKRPSHDCRRLHAAALQTIFTPSRHTQLIITYQNRIILDAAVAVPVAVVGETLSLVHLALFERQLIPNHTNLPAVREELQPVCLHPRHFQAVNLSRLH